MGQVRRDLMLCATVNGAELADRMDKAVRLGEADPAAPVRLPRRFSRLKARPRPVSARASYRAKLAGDKVAALLLLGTLLPLLLLIAAIVRLESPGPALFSQERVGYRQRRFRCYKFRTMYHHLQDPRATVQATRDDHRVTAFGRLLRRTSLDELPQLLNVLKGEMSLVGPRPHAPETRAGGRAFEEVVPFYHERHAVVPGITGWAQVSGWRGETRTAEDIAMRVRYDLIYIRAWSPLFDARILALTLIRMFNDDTAV